MGLQYFKSMLHTLLLRTPHLKNLVLPHVKPVNNEMLIEDFDLFNVYIYISKRRRVLLLVRE